MKTAILTAGCRLNQADSDLLRGRLAAAGAVFVDEPERADICYVNTCSVTAAADRSSIQLVRRAGRAGRVVVLGCLAECEPQRLAGLPGVVEVWGRQRLAAELARARPAPVRSRAFLKVQDGCDRGCGFCRPGRLRGAPVSVPPEAVVEQLHGLVETGFREIVLTGLNLGLYRSNGLDLAGLVGRLLEVGGRFRLRLGSLEPDTVTDRLAAACGNERVCPHFHLALQSGDDALLAKMNRRHSVADSRRAVAALLSVRPEARVGADVIAGLPGEDEDSFGRTRAFVAGLGLGYLHVFRFSAREETPAAAMPDTVPEQGKRERVNRLRGLSDGLAERYSARFAGTVRVAVVESSRTALTDNYLRVRLEGPVPVPPRGLARVLVTGGGKRPSGRVVETRTGNPADRAGDRELLEVQ
ncbi:radical SAM protein [candidate division WOR-3 bacterium]|nr:radical SAM protein [candidate division WOR-3 bacterium]